MEADIMKCDSCKNYHLRQYKQAVMNEEIKNCKGYEKRGD